MQGQPAGAEVFTLPESPTQKRKRRGLWVAAYGLIGLLLIAAVMAFLHFSPVLATKNIQTTGNHLLSEKAVVKKLQPLKDTPLPRITDGEVAQLLAEESAISSSRIQIKLPDTLIVHLIEYDPVVVVQTKTDKSTSYALYNSLGQNIKTLGGKKEADGFKLPVVDSAQATKDKNLFVTVTKVLGDVGPKLRQQMTSADAKTVDSVVLKLKDGREVFWGNAENEEKKRAVLQALMKNESQRAKQAASGKLENYKAAKVFDVSTPDQPVLR